MQERVEGPHISGGTCTPLALVRGPFRWAGAFQHVCATNEAERRERAKSAAFACGVITAPRAPNWEGTTEGRVRRESGSRGHQVCVCVASSWDLAPLETWNVFTV